MESEVFFALDNDGPTVLVIENNTESSISARKLETEEGRDFELPASELLRHRIGIFVDGLALGSAAFVESVFEKNRAKMAVRRSQGVRVPKQALGGLRTLRELRGVGS